MQHTQSLATSGRTIDHRYESSDFFAMIGAVSILVEVFVRYEFGERYLSIPRAIFGVVILILYWAIPTIVSLLTFNAPAQNSPLIGWFTLAYMGFAISHELRIWLRTEQRRVPWHSWSFGLSRFEFLGLPQIPLIGHGDWALYRFYEPFICFIISVSLWMTGIDRPVGLLVFLASLALLWRNNVVYFDHRKRRLDTIDARIEGAYYNEEAFGRGKNNVAGLAPVEVALPDIPSSVRPTSTHSNLSMTLENYGDYEPEITNRKAAFASTVAEVMG